MQIGNVAARKKLTGRLFFQRIGADYVDLGNVMLTKQEPKLDRAQQLTADKGRMRVTREAIGKVDPRWSFKLDEQLGPQLRLLNLATENVDQAAVEEHEVQEMDPVLNEAIDLGYKWISNVVVTNPVGGAEGVEYQVDSENGTITPISEAWLNGLEGPLTVTFDAPAIKNYTMLSEAFVRGTAIIILYDQHNAGPAGKISFSAEIRTSDWGDNDGQKINEFTLELLALSEPVVLSRD